MGKLVGIREFARMRGVSQTAVQKAIKAGRIQVTTDPKGKPKIDADAAMRQWELNTDPAKQRGAPPAAATLPTAASDGDRAGRAYAVARAMREEYQARLAKLDYESKAGKLVDATKVKLEAFQAARIARDAILNIPNKISHELAAETDPAKIHARLTEVLHQSLEELAAEGRRRAQSREES